MLKLFDLYSSVKIVTHTVCSDTKPVDDIVKITKLY